MFEVALQSNFPEFSCFILIERANFLILACDGDMGYVSSLQSSKQRDFSA